MKIIHHVLQKFLLGVEKIIGLLDGKYKYPEFEEELKKILNELVSIFKLHLLKFSN